MSEEIVVGDITVRDAVHPTGSRDGVEVWPDAPAPDDDRDHRLSEFGDS